MASIYEKQPIFRKERKWTEKDLKTLEKKKFQGNHMKAEVPVYGGDYGTEFFVSKTLPDFMAAGNRLDWTWPESFVEFGNVLEGSPKTVWEQVLDTYAALDRNLQSSFDTCIAAFICKMLNNPQPRDAMWIYLSPFGDNKSNRFFKDLTTSPVEHLRRFLELHRHSLILPAGHMADPGARLLVEWLYMSYHQNDRMKFTESGKNLDSMTLESLTQYFQAIWEQKMATGTLKVEQPREQSRSKPSAERGRQDDRRNDSRTSSRSSSYRDRDRRDSDRGRDRTRDTSYRNRGNSSNSTRPRESSSASKPKALNGPPCPEHSRDGQPARHTWAECSRNPANQNKRSDNRRADDAHHVDSGYRSDDSRSNSSHHTPVPSDNDDDSVVSVDENYATFDEPMKSGSTRANDRKRDNKRRRHDGGSGRKYKSYDDGDDDHYAADPSHRDDTNPLDF